VGQSIVKKILEELGYHKKSDRFIPYNLNEYNKKMRVQFAKENLQLIQKEGEQLFFERVIAADETPIYLYEPSKRKAFVKEGEQPQTAERRKIKKDKVNAIVFYDYKGIVHIEWVKVKNQFCTTFKVFSGPIQSEEKNMPML
jgi:hypothetical protein